MMQLMKYLMQLKLKVQGSFTFNICLDDIALEYQLYLILASVNSILQLLKP